MYKYRPKPQVDVKALLVEKLNEEKKRFVSNKAFEPTGLQEDVIYAVGSGKFQIVLALHANDVGKTATGIQILKNIMGPCDEKWFAWWDGYSLFRDKVWSLKTFRITGTSEALSDNGPIRQEMNKWWPSGQWSAEKAGKHHYSQFTCWNGWRGDALTYNQDRKEYESGKFSVILSDEPPDHSLVGAITSRFSEDGFLWIITATPVQCGIFLDIIDDLEEKGLKDGSLAITRLTGTAWENSQTSGKPNHLGTRMGLRTDSQVSAKVASCPPEEFDARIMGKASNKSGKVYPMFDPQVHKINFDWARLPDCNCFMAIDPHRKYYPAIKWYAVTPDARVVVYNEFPTVSYLAGAYYDEIRTSRQCDLTPDQLARIILQFDLADKGARIQARVMDPRFAAENPQYVQALELALNQLSGGKGCTHFDLPKCERIDSQRVVLQQLMTYNSATEASEWNCPDWYVSSLCLNSIRAYSRHFWEERVVGRMNDSKEAEDFKDLIDCDRYFLGYIGGKPTYKQNKPVENVGATVSATNIFMPTSVFFQQTVSV